MSYYYIRKRIERIRKFLFTKMIASSFQAFGEKTDIDPTFFFDNPKKICIGNDVQIKRGVVMDGRSKNNYGIYLDEGVHIKEYAYLDAYGGSIFLGKNVRIGHHSVLAGHGGITISDNSGVSGLSYIIAANHIFNDLDTPFLSQGETKEGIFIGKNVWGASGIIITDGVTIGDNAIIGAGAVVRKNVPAGAVVVGNPAELVYIRE